MLYKDTNSFQHASQEYLAKYLSDQKMFQIQIAQENETYTSSPIHFLRKFSGL
jgi:hypothetical protein